MKRLQRLRAAGWTVAIHNDYHLNGEQFTFWMLTKDNKCIKGEGKTDEEALAQAESFTQMTEEDIEHADWCSVNSSCNCGAETEFFKQKRAKDSRARRKK